MKLVFQASRSDAASRKTITPFTSPVRFADTFPHKGKAFGFPPGVSGQEVASEKAPVSPLRLGRDGHVWEAFAAGFQLPRLSGRGAFPAVFVIAFDMQLQVVYHRPGGLSSGGKQKQEKYKFGFSLEKDKKSVDKTLEMLYDYFRTKKCL